MYDMLAAANYKKVSDWLTELDKEYKKTDFCILNESEVPKIYMIGSKDYIFKNGWKQE